MDILYIIIGIALLYFGGEYLLSGAVATAEKLDIPKVFTAVVLIGFGTSAPELFVTLNALYIDIPAIAVGNILGSNVANILLVASLGMILAPITTKIKGIGYESIFFLGASAFPIITSYFFGGVGFIVGIGALLSLGIYFLLAMKRPNADEMDEEFEPLSYGKIILYVLTGLIMLVFGAKALIQGATAIALNFGISEAVIGLSMVAVGTSLPEIATSIAAARRGEGKMIIGNVLGSNIFNVLLILGISSMVKFVNIPFSVFITDGLIGLISAAVLLILIYAKKLTIPFGILGLITYAGYIYTWTIR